MLRALALLASARLAAGQDLFLASDFLAPRDSKTDSQKLPHIVFLLSDDLGWSNVGFHNSEVHTPNLDALQATGLELTRHYAYKFCSPSRSSFLSGRLPVHVNERNKITEAPLAGVHPNMTMFPAKLKAAGYRTHHIGKWHAGMASRSKNIPIARGFDTGLTYFHGAEDHYQQTCRGNVDCGKGKKYKYTDLWLNDGPAVGINGTDYSCHIYRKRALDLIEQHDPTTPFFLFLAFANNHMPLQVPDEYLAAYPKLRAPNWRIYQGMITAVDVAIGEVVEALKKKGMWEDTLLVWTSDNGGPLSSGNNYPLRGGKTSNFEGGFRVPALVNGGVLPEARRGQKYDGITTFADWYTTFCAVAGVDALDQAAASSDLPPVDGHDLSAAIFQGSTSPWAGKPLLLSSHAADPVINPQQSSVLILDDYKLINGAATTAAWTAPISPNLTHPFGPAEAVLHCGGPAQGGCLFDVVADPGEHQDLSASHPEVLKRLIAAKEEAMKTVYNPDRGDPGVMPCQAAAASGGYWTPYLP